MLQQKGTLVTIKKQKSCRSELRAGQNFFSEFLNYKNRAGQRKTVPVSGISAGGAAITAGGAEIKQKSLFKMEFRRRRSFKVSIRNRP